MKRLQSVAAGVLAMLAFSGPAAAGDSAAPLAILEQPGFAAIAESELAEQSGRQGFDHLLQINNSEQLSTLEGNVLTAPGLTGYNAIGGGSFVGNAGFNTVIQNSGNQVIIQDSTLVNILFTQ